MVNMLWMSLINALQYVCMSMFSVCKYCNLYNYEKKLCMNILNLNYIIRMNGNFTFVNICINFMVFIQLFLHQKWSKLFSVEHAVKIDIDCDMKSFKHILKVNPL